MYKKALGELLLFNLIILFGMLSVLGISQNRQASVPAYQVQLDERVLSQKGTSTLGIVESAISEQRVVNVLELEKRSAYELDEEDLDALMRIVEAEAGNQDTDGRLLVANVVLNRVESEKFPNTVREVVMQKEKGVYQFSPVGSGRIWKVRISEETSEAVGRALEGEDISEGALYFAARRYADTGKMRWFDEHLTYLFEHGGHEFYR